MKLRYSSKRYYLIDSWHSHLLASRFYNNSLLSTALKEKLRDPKETCSFDLLFFLGYDRLQFVSISHYFCFYIKFYIKISFHFRNFSIFNKKILLTLFRSTFAILELLWSSKLNENIQLSLNPNRTFKCYL